MRVSRLDLGADVVHLPSRDLLVIHPDLDYAEALGAVMGTLPDLHPDVAVSLVEQVTPRPRLPDRLDTIGRRAGQAVAAMLVSALVAFALGPEPAAAFGPTWAQEMEQMGMACKPPRDGTTTCTATDKRVVRVEGYRRDNATLYLVDRPGVDETYLLVFDTMAQAAQYAAEHPHRELAGRVVIW